MGVTRSLMPLILFGVAAVSQPNTQRGSRDPAFDKVPFDEWLAHPSETRMKWTARTSRAELSVHQRLMTQVNVQVDGEELARRSGKGRFVIFLQFSDEQGRVYQNHTTIDLEKVDERIGAQNVECVMSAFVLPGDYRVAVAIFYSATGEHSTREEKVRFPPLKNDPLPDMWRDLPSVEFTEAAQSPDNWYLPSMTGRLHLNVATRHPLRVEVIVNLTPSELQAGSNRAQTRNLGTLLPSLKAISQVEFHDALLNVELLDLSRRQVVFRQDNVHGLHWPGIRDALAEKAPGVIDVKSLEDRRHNAGFFVKEVTAKLAVAQPPVALIILSSPMTFGEGQDREPVSATTPADCRVFYVRYHASPALRSDVRGYSSGTGRGGRRPSVGGMERIDGVPRLSARAPQDDQLASTLKPLGLRLFDVQTAEQFRRALAAILTEISTM